MHRPRPKSTKQMVLGEMGRQQTLMLGVAYTEGATSFYELIHDAPEVEIHF